MASPQKENGYTAISNELLDDILYRDFTIGEIALLLFVIRKTYGFHKKTDKIALSQFEKVGFNHRNTCKIIKRLLVMNVIKKDDGKYGINKNFDTWLVSHRTLGKKVVASVAQDTRVVSHRTLTKETIQKKYSVGRECKKKTKEEPVDNSLGREVNEVIGMFKKFNPEFGRFYSNKTQRGEIEGLIKNRGLEYLKEVLEYYSKHSDEQYIPKIFTPRDLADKLVRLEDYYKKNNK